MTAGKHAFEVSMADVAQTQLQGKNDVFLEFHVDDTTGANEVRIHVCVLFNIINHYIFPSSIPLLSVGYQKAHSFSRTDRLGQSYLNYKSLATYISYV